MKRRRKMNEGSTSTLSYWTHRPCSSLRSTLTMLVVSKETVSLCEEQTRDVVSQSPREQEQVSQRSLKELLRAPHLNLGKQEPVLLQLLKGGALPQLW